MWNPSLICFLLLLVLVAQTPLSSNASKAPVLDVEGNELKSGLSYHIVSAIWGSGGGGLSISNRSFTDHPNVNQHASESRQGKSIAFCPASSPGEKIIQWTRKKINREIELGEITIRESTDINIRFTSTDSVWQLGHMDESTGKRYVTIGGEGGNPGRSTVKNWFKIERFGGGESRCYRLVYCPSVCKRCRTVCGELHIAREGEKRWLSLSEYDSENKAFPLVFIRSEE